MIKKINHNEKRLIIIKKICDNNENENENQNENFNNNKQYRY